MTRKNVQKVKGREGDLVGDSKKRVKKPGPETEKNIYKVGEKVNQDGGQEEKKQIEQNFKGTRFEGVKKGKISTTTTTPS